jgi:hypothetical protein
VLRQRWFFKPSEEREAIAAEICLSIIHASAPLTRMYPGLLEKADVIKSSLLLL